MALDTKTWFDSLGDADLKTEAVIKKPDIFIAQYLFEGSAVFDDTADDFTVTGTPFVVDELISLGLKNLMVIDDNGKVASVLIDDNGTSDIQFTQANLLLLEDGVTAATLTDTNSYSIRVLTPTTAIEPFGKFFGFTEANELNINDEFAKFKYSTPKVEQFKDLIERCVFINPI